MNKSGFILVEWLIYSVILSFFALLVMQWVVLSHHQMATALNERSINLSLVVALDVVVRDLKRMVAGGEFFEDAQGWFCWSMGDEIVGFTIVDENLLRIQGVIDHTGQWSSATTSLIMQGVGAHDIVYEDKSSGLVRCGIETIAGVRAERYLLLLR